MDFCEKSQAAHDIVTLIPLLMRYIGADMRCFGGGLAPSHFALLGSLSLSDRSLTELAEQQVVTLATISNSIATMVEKGYVERITPAHDRRIVQVRITPAGRKLLGEVHRQLEQRVEALLAGLTAEEVEQLDQGIHILRKVFATATWKNTSRCEDSSVSGEQRAQEKK